MYYIRQTDRHRARWGEWYSCPGLHSPRGSKMDSQISILNEKSDFLHSTKFKLLRQIIEIQ